MFQGLTVVWSNVSQNSSQPFKHRLRQKYMAWCIQKYRSLGNERLPKPCRQEVSQWVNDVWESLSESIIQNSWRGCGFRFMENNDEHILNDSEQACGDEDIVLDLIKSIVSTTTIFCDLVNLIRGKRLSPEESTC